METLAPGLLVLPGRWCGFIPGPNEQVRDFVCARRLFENVPRMGACLIVRDDHDNHLGP